jgi:EF-hand domain/EF hand
MTKHILMLTTAAFILGCGAMDASAEQGSNTAIMQQSEQAQQDPTDEGGPGMMRHCMRQCMMGDGTMGDRMMRHGMMGQGGMMGSFAMRIIFALMDSDGDGTVSLQEFQAAHEKIFKAMDANKDGVLTPKEIQAFMRGTSKSAAQHEEEHEQEQEDDD